MSAVVNGSAAGPNRILAALPAREYARLRNRLEPVPLPEGAVLYEPEVPITHVYFPESGLVSIVATVGEGAIAEAGLVGREGMAGLPLFLGQDRTPFRAMVQVPGQAQRMKAADFRAVLGRASALAGLLARFAHVFLVHVGQSAACNAHHSVERRCCRWLLLARDRLGQDDFPLTHEYLAIMLGTRRTGVTEVAGKLQRAGLIRYRRGQIRILNPAGLEQACCSCYCVIRGSYDGLFAPPGEA